MAEAVQAGPWHLYSLGQAVCEQPELKPGMIAMVHDGKTEVLIEIDKEDMPPGRCFLTAFVSRSWKPWKTGFGHHVPVLLEALSELGYNDARCLIGKDGKFTMRLAIVRALGMTKIYEDDLVQGWCMTWVTVDKAVLQKM